MIDLTGYHYLELFEIVRKDQLSAAAVNDNKPAKKAQLAKSWEEAGGCDNYFTSLAGSMRARGFSEDAIHAALSTENGNLDEPMDDDRVRKIARSIGKKPVGRRFFPCSDAGNAERFQSNNPDIRYMTDRDIWLYYNGFRWAHDEKGSVAHHQALLTVRKIHEEAESCDDSEIRQAVLSWARKSESADRLSAILRVARTLPGVRCRQTDFDRDPWVLNTESGILDLRNGQLKPHDREAKCSKMAPVRYVPGARHAVLEKYLHASTGGDDAFICFLQRAMGYSLTGDTGAECFFMVLGPGGSGKTTLVEAFKCLLGDYAITTAARTLLEKRTDSGGGHSSDIARMHGHRLICTSEIPPGRKLDAALVKSLTGGERIVARTLYEADSEFMPMGKFWLAANHAPGVDDDDSGMWRRIIRVPFSRVVPESERDPLIKRAMMTDPDVRSAMLSWALQGALDWQSRGGGGQGLAVPAVVSAATKVYQEESNPIRDFVDECCELTAGLAAVSDVRQAYASWCRTGGSKPLGPHEFNQRLERMGCARITAKDSQGRSVKSWRGLTIVSDSSTVTM